MAGRIRSIKPEILDDDEIVGLSDECWRLWVSMFALADDYGNLPGSDRFLSSRVWQDSSRKVFPLLVQLQLANRIEPYDVAGRLYVHIRNWEKHQRIDNAGAKKVPKPEEGTPVNLAAARRGPPREVDQPPREPTPLAAILPPLDGMGLEGIGKEQIGGAAPEVVCVSSVEETGVRAIRPAAETQAVQEVLSYWAEKLHPGQSVKFDEKRKKRIRARLAEKFTVDDLKLAADGALRDDWLMGRKDGTPKNGWRGVETIFRDAEQVERLMKLAPAAPGRPRNDDRASADTGQPTGVRKLASEAPSEPELSVAEHGKRAAEFALRLKAIGGGGSK